jgi:hypothetical protein
VARLNELDLVSTEAGQATEQGVDAVAGVAEYTPNAPPIQAFPEEIANSLCHVDPPCSTLTQGTRQARRQLPRVRKFIENVLRQPATVGLILLL